MKRCIFEVKWVSIVNGLNKEIIEPLHHVLVDMFNEKFGGNVQLEKKYFQPNTDGKMP